MTSVIKLLSPLLANQIAAGEVVERPSSCVKELIENSLDAGAKRIEVALTEGGLSTISITDDGCGIHKEDLALALSRHATSKVKEVEDLAAIYTLGFRGEALASIASVSDLTLMSKPADQECAYSVQVKGLDREPVIKSCSHPDGTSVLIQNLFYNTPARRKFLKSEKTEMSAIENMLKALALSHFEVGFTLMNNQKTLFQLPPATTFAGKELRIKKILGNKFFENARYSHFEAMGLTLSAWVGNEQAFRRQNDQQFIFVNNRYIKDKVIHHAVKVAYQPWMTEGNHPSLVLYLNINPAEVDVNVHPTKHEVRFSDQRSIHDFVQTSLVTVLAAESEESSPETLSDEGMRYQPSVLQPSLPQSGQTSEAKVSALFKPYAREENFAQKISAQNTFYQSTLAGKGTSSVSGFVGSANSVVIAKAIDSWQHYGVKIGSFLVLEHHQKSYVVNLNQMAQFVFSQSPLDLTSCSLLFPEIILLEPYWITVAEENVSILNQLGFDWIAHRFDEQILGIKLLSFPKILTGVNLKAGFLMFLKQLKNLVDVVFTPYVFFPFIDTAYLNSLDKTTFYQSLDKGIENEEPFVKALSPADLEQWMMKGVLIKDLAEGLVDG